MNTHSVIEVVVVDETRTAPPSANHGAALPLKQLTKEQSEIVMLPSLFANCGQAEPATVSADCVERTLADRHSWVRRIHTQTRTSGI
ncbi:hypothetical protein BLNAU_23816 [Blattamonas nauphoetae]|uniref:Uncharacterized protein n=1 Tax=Blattamonas nauphoetae TaxID=2049346 RepID=A0ABQ9WP76_9EUKA|nr:hypothetical protein BLNAU_23816 [Blattamonas nauphoetae]